METLLSFKLGKPNINGLTYTADSFIKALDTAIQEGLLVYGDKENSKAIGKAISYEIKESGEVIITLDFLTKEYEQVVNPPMLVSTISVGEVLKDQIVRIDEVQRLFPILDNVDEHREFFNL